jgi:hypothetical protein
MTNRLIVQWRNDVDPAIYRIGLLTRDATYRFEYLGAAADAPGFRPLPPFPRLGSVYESERLFPFFSARVLDDRRPDYGDFLRALGLEPPGDIFAALGRSGGRRKGDFISLVEEPLVAPSGWTEHVFLVHGVRHVAKPDARDRALARLRTGDRLKLLPEPMNPVNDKALVVADSADSTLGWVPDGLLPYVTRLLPAEPDLSVVRINGPEQPDQLRLLVRLTGRLPAGEPALPGLDVWVPEPPGPSMSEPAASVRV